MEVVGKTMSVAGEVVVEAYWCTVMKRRIGLEVEVLEMMRID